MYLFITCAYLKILQFCDLVLAFKIASWILFIVNIIYFYLILLRYNWQIPCPVSSTSWFTGGCFSWCPYMVGGAVELSGASFLRALTPSWELHPHDRPNLLPKASPPNTERKAYWTLRFHIWIWGSHKHLVYSTGHSMLHIYRVTICNSGHCNPSPGRFRLLINS